MTRINFEADVPDGQHLGVARDEEGGLRALLYRDGTNELVGHLNLHQVTDVEDEHGDRGEARGEGSCNAELDQLKLQIALTALLFVVEVSRPHAERWWHETGAPAVRARSARAKARWAGRSRRKAGEGRDAVALEVAPRPVAAPSPIVIEIGHQPVVEAVRLALVAEAEAEADELGRNHSLPGGAALA